VTYIWKIFSGEVSAWSLIEPRGVEVVPDGAVSLSARIGFGREGYKAVERSRNVTIARHFLEFSNPAA
jgi:hypothetical protein